MNKCNAILPDKFTERSRDVTIHVSMRFHRCLPDEFTLRNVRYWRELRELGDQRGRVSDDGRLTSGTKRTGRCLKAAPSRTIVWMRSDTERVQEPDRHRRWKNAVFADDPTLQILYPPPTRRDQMSDPLIGVQVRKTFIAEEAK